MKIIWNKVNTPGFILLCFRIQYCKLSKICRSPALNYQLYLTEGSFYITFFCGFFAGNYSWAISVKTFWTPGAPIASLLRNYMDQQPFVHVPIFLGRSLGQTVICLYASSLPLFLACSCLPFYFGIIQLSSLCCLLSFITSSALLWCVLNFSDGNFQICLSLPPIHTFFSSQIVNLQTFLPGCPQVSLAHPSMFSQNGTSFFLSVVIPYCACFV